MKRQMIRLAMATVLVLVTIIAALVWSGDYEKNPDPAAVFHIEGVRLEADHGYMWLEAHLRKSQKEKHDLLKPVRLITSNGKKHEAADTTFAGTPETGFTDIWLKFWLEKTELEGPIYLEINDGELTIKNSDPIPELDPPDKDTVFKSSDWEKSWLGF
ncbi:MAG: hypothetical protein AB8D78_05670 [Akkermansiaceae bacterium]